MIETKRYMISYGEYSDYQVVAQLEGSASANLADLYREFEKEVFPENTHILHRSNAKYMAVENARQLGYEGSDLGYCFASWLCKKHGFASIQFEEFNVKD